MQERKVEEEIWIYIKQECEKEIKEGKTKENRRSLTISEVTFLKSS